MTWNWELKWTLFSPMLLLTRLFHHRNRRQARTLSQWVYLAYLQSTHRGVTYRKMGNMKQLHCSRVTPRPGWNITKVAPLSPFPVSLLFAVCSSISQSQLWAGVGRSSRWLLGVRWLWYLRSGCLGISALGIGLLNYCLGYWAKVVSTPHWWTHYTLRQWTLTFLPASTL